jgi:hypothetical protein
LSIEEVPRVIQQGRVFKLKAKCADGRRCGPTGSASLEAFSRSGSALRRSFNPKRRAKTSRPYMGAFWTLTGVVNIRSALSGERTRGVRLVSGCVGVVAGLVVLAHERVDDVVAQSVLFSWSGS